MRSRAAVFVIDGPNVLLFHRFRNGWEYYAVPGGGVDEGETPEHAAVRELKEETTLDVTLGPKLGELITPAGREHFYIADEWHGTPRLGPNAEEFARQSPDNTYELEWVPVASLAGDSLLRPEIANLLIAYIFYGTSAGASTHRGTANGAGAAKADAGTGRGLFEKVRKFYARIERPFSSISLVAGFVFDAVTLTRVDEFWDNLWVVVHLAIVTICALLIHLIEHEHGAEENPAKLHFWLVNVMQFFFGGIFSTFLVFYFRSGSLVNDWPFLAILAAAFIANERLKRHYARLIFQIILLFISYYAFAIYIIPILVHRLGTLEFIASGAASVGLILGFIFILAKWAHEPLTRRAKWFAGSAIVIILALMNFLYFENLIPPLPLSLKDSGIYQEFTVNGPGNYTAQSESQPWWSFFDWSEPVHVTIGTPLYAYTAVFSPTALNTPILHVWQYYNASSSAWVTRAMVKLPVTGGGENGWRTFSEMPAVTPGSWRVNVETPGGQVIGQLRFNVTTVSSTPALSTTQID